MYDDIRKPRLLKDIPMVFIRALPPIYYFGKFVDSSIPKKVKELFNSNVVYLSKAMKEAGQKLKSEKLTAISKSISELNSLPSAEILKHLEKATVSLSQFCSEHRDEIRKYIKDVRSSLIDSYNNTVTKLNILLIDNNNEPQQVEKLSATLKNYCYYTVDTISSAVSDYSIQMIKSDFVIFASTHPPQIHDDIKNLQTYNKPGFALARIEKDGEVDKQAVRHGSQLINIGVEVLFKIFTPIRLYTNIDKTYMKFHLQK
jgi:hypothetical protein